MTPYQAFQGLGLPVQLWLIWLLVLQLGALAFIRHSWARWVLVPLLANVLSMMLLQRIYGGGAHMGLPHIVFWTPLLILLFARRTSIAAAGTASVIWAVLLAGSISLSLLIDTRHVALWFAALL